MTNQTWLFSHKELSTQLAITSHVHSWPAECDKVQKVTGAFAMQAINMADTGSKCVNSNVKATTTNVTNTHLDTCKLKDIPWLCFMEKTKDILYVVQKVQNNKIWYNNKHRLN